MNDIYVLTGYERSQPGNDREVVPVPLVDGHKSSSRRLDARSQVEDRPERADHNMEFPPAQTLDQFTENGLSPSRAQLTNYVQNSDPPHLTHSWPSRPVFRAGDKTDPV